METTKNFKKHWKYWRIGLLVNCGLLEVWNFGSIGRMDVSLLLFHQLLLELGGNENYKSKIERMGRSVGESICEKHLFSTFATKPFEKVDEVVVWLCKVFWTKTFGKRIDSLKTNNRGTFVLLDNNFALTRLFPDSSSDDRNKSSGSTSFDTKHEDLALYFASQVVLGALQRLNVLPTIKGDFVRKHSHKAVTFTIVL